MGSAGKPWELPSAVWLPFLRDQPFGREGSAGGASEEPACTPESTLPPFPLADDHLYQGYAQVARVGLLPLYSLYLHAQRAGLDPCVALGQPECAWQAVRCKTIVTSCTTGCAPLVPPAEATDLDRTRRLCNARSLQERVRRALEAKAQPIRG